MAETERMDDDDRELARVTSILRSIDPDDVEGIEPPADIWAGIEAALVDDRRARPRVSMTRDATPRLTVEYSIDGHDVVSVGDGWAEAAISDEAPELAVPTPGRTLWSHMAGDEILVLWLQIVDRVRTDQTAVRVPFRCDGPAARRWFEMDVSPEPDRGVRFRSTLVFAEARNPIPLLDHGIERDDDLDPVVLCAWCGHALHHGVWVELEEIVRVGRLLEADRMPAIEAGVCGCCRDEMATDLGLTASA